MFSKVLSDPESKIGGWIKRNGGEKEVLGSDDKCFAMIKQEMVLVPVKRAVRGKLETDVKMATADFQKEYRQDIEGIIKENLETFTKLFQMSLNDFSKDLGNKIERQGDRLIRYLRGGPRSRIKDKVTLYISILKISDFLLGR